MTYASSIATCDVHLYTRVDLISNCVTEANLLLPLRIQKLKGFQLQGGGGFAPADPLTRGSAPGPRWGVGSLPPDPCYRLAFPRSPCPGLNPPKHDIYSGLAPEQSVLSVLCHTFLIGVVKVSPVDR